MDPVIATLSPHEYAEAERLIRVACPERIESISRRPETQKLADEDNQYSIFLVARQSNRIAGYGAAWPQRKGRFRIALIVAEDHQRRGLGSLLLDRLVDELQEQGATLVQARASDARTETLAFLHKRGFVETNRMIDLALVVKEANLASIHASTERLASPGIVITTLACEQERNPDYRGRLRALVIASPYDCPDPYVTTSRPSSEAETVARMGVWSTPIPEAFFIARQGDRWMGYSFLEARDGRVSVGETAVHIDWRRRGIAVALKLRTLQYARSRALVELTTRTASPGMAALNIKLGFRRGNAEVRMVKSLE